MYMFLAKILTNQIMIFTVKNATRELVVLYDHSMMILNQHSTHILYLILHIWL